MSNQNNQSDHETMDNDTFQGQREPFVALPTWIRGELDLPSIGILWLLQSYQPEGGRLFTRLEKDSGLTREEIITILQRLEDNGYVKTTPSTGAPARLELCIWGDPSNNQERSA
jgi:hypothetical protein